MSETRPLPLLVIGAGIAGITTAIEAAEAGREVVLVEKEPCVGGRVLRNHHYFPKMCPPSCGMELNTRRLERNPRVRVLTGATVTGVLASSDAPQDVTIRRGPLYVTERCTACGACSEACPAKVKDAFDYGMAEKPAIRLPHAYAWPRRFTLDRAACPAGCRACVDACEIGAIDLDAKPTEDTMKVGAIVIATGWEPYPLENLGDLGGGRLPDVISNVQMERLASPAGPSGGKIVRPSDGVPPKRVAFVQCAGSRDVKHLPYCSAVCCLASLKQAIYVKDQLPDAEVAIYYIDRRTPGRNEELLTRTASLSGVRLIKGKVGTVQESGGELHLKLEDVGDERLVDAVADLVVLATGMKPTVPASLGLPNDEDGFAVEDPAVGLLVAGVARRPTDVAGSVRDATGAAAKACAALATLGRRSAARTPAREAAAPTEALAAAGRRG